VLFFGSWNPIDRGGDIALKAMVHVLRERPRARLLLSCRGPQTETLRRLAHDLGIERSVEFLGFVPGEKLAETFRSASVAVFPSRLGFGIQEMHAMYAGVPLVVTDVRDQSYFVGKDGIVCPSEDPEALGVQLARLLGDEHLQAELARRGRSKIRNFSSERMVEETLQAYAAAGWMPRG
jgi:glycosyltransferase involved in cell wall biosynthesis